MRRFLVRFFNDRNTEQRISTRKEQMELHLFYKADTGEIRKVRVGLDVSGRSVFLFASANGETESIRIVGVETAKLGMVRQ